jgi:hypothetical protein
MGFAAPVAAAIGIIGAAGGAAASIYAATRSPEEIKRIPEPSDEEVQRKALKRQENIRGSRERFLQRQATLGPIQLQAPALGGV